MRGVAYSSGNKLAIARQLARLNVDEIEAGFPSISPDEMEAIEAIAADVKGKRIAVLVRALKGDIDAAKQALRKADRPVVTIFCPASDRQIRAKLNRTREEALSMATQAIRYAKGHFPEVSFAPEDATRAAKDYLHQLIRAALEAGATTISISDTVGYAQPSEFGLMIREICAITRNSADLRAHCHNDLGLAVANSLAAMENGANVISCTVNGMGERAGNAPL
jgi:2-isopropylmalate synthase